MKQTNRYLACALLLILLSVIGWVITPTCVRDAPRLTRVCIAEKEAEDKVLPGERKPDHARPDGSDAQIRYRASWRHLYHYRVGSGLFSKRNRTDSIRQCCYRSRDFGPESTERRQAGRDRRGFLQIEVT